MIYLLAFLIGIVAGLRTMTPLAAVSWAAALGWIAPPGWLAFLGYTWTPWILTALAIGEFVTDKLPSTPSRKAPMQFGARIVVGAVCGAALVSSEAWWIGAVLGAAGAVVGTLGGASVRNTLAARFGRDLPAALIEDAVAVVGAALIVSAA